MFICCMALCSHWLINLLYMSYGESLKRETLEIVYNEVSAVWNRLGLGLHSERSLICSDQGLYCLDSCVFVFVSV